MTKFVDSPVKSLTYFFILVLISSCVTDSDQSGDTEEPAKDVVSYTEGIRLSWDYQTLTRVYDGRVFYPRIIRLQNGDLLCAFESIGEVYLSRSADKGKTWQQAELTAPRDGDVISATPELIQLENGRIILLYNPKPPAIIKTRKIDSE